MTQIFLSLGSNIDPERNIPRAVEIARELTTVVAVSSVWQSAAVGYAAQADFLNAAILVEDVVDPECVYKRWIPAIESRLKRRRDPANKNAPRTIDVDLSLFGEIQAEVADHTIPDPDIVKRAFVAVPLAELSADFLHPVERRTLGAIAADLAVDSLTRRDDVSL